MKWLKILHFIHGRLCECDSIKSEAVEQHSRQNGRTVPRGGHWLGEAGKVKGSHGTLSLSWTGSHALG